MARVSATHQVQRLLSIVPWVRGRPAPPTVAEVCERFEITADQLAADLQLLSFVGVPPYTPDVLVDAWVDDDVVQIHGEYFDQPLRLSQQEALALVAAGVAAASEPGYDADGPLARGVAKIAAVLGLELDDDLSISLGPVADEVIEPLRVAVADHRVVRLRYYGHARNVATERDVEPARIFSAEGAWYLMAWCRRADAERQFRLDRVLDLALLDETFEPRPLEDRGAFMVDESIRRVIVEVDHTAHWVAERYPTDAVEPTPDGGQLVTLPVAALPWLERLLLRLGPNGRVVDGTEREKLAGAGAAERILARYDR